MRFLRCLLALAMLPLVWGAAGAFVDVLRSIPAPAGSVFPAELVAVLGGLLAFLAAWMFLPAPVRLYVLGHELTHAVWGLAFGAKVSRLKVGPSGGSVSLSKSNVWITLAPYFFPFWTIVVVLAAVVVQMFVSPLPAPCAWLFAVGFTWCFHICFTIRSLMQFQPDIHEYGRFFSYVLICLFNVVLVTVWLVCTTGVTWKTAGSSLWRRTASAYGAVGSASVAAFDLLAKRLEQDVEPGNQHDAD